MKKAHDYPNFNEMNVVQNHIMIFNGTVDPETQTCAMAQKKILEIKCIDSTS